MTMPMSDMCHFAPPRGQQKVQPPVRIEARLRLHLANHPLVCPQQTAPVVHADRQVAADAAENSRSPCHFPAQPRQPAPWRRAPARPTAPAPPAMRPRQRNSSVPDSGAPAERPGCARCGAPSRDASAPASRCPGARPRRPARRLPGERRAPRSAGRNPRPPGTIRNAPPAAPTLRNSSARNSAAVQGAEQMRRGVAKGRAVGAAAAHAPGACRRGRSGRRCRRCGPSRARVRILPVANQPAATAAQALRSNPAPVPRRCSAPRSSRRAALRDAAIHGRGEAGVAAHRESRARRAPRASSGAPSAEPLSTTSSSPAGRVCAARLASSRCQQLAAVPHRHDGGDAHRKKRFLARNSRF